MTARRIIGSIPRGLLLHDSELGILWVLPDPKCESDPAVSSALALRNRATLEGVCPGCGGVELPAVGVIVIEHEADCPAATVRLKAQPRRTRRTRRRGARGGNT